MISADDFSDLEFLLEAVAESPVGCPDTICAFCSAPLSAPHGTVNLHDCPVEIAKRLIATRALYAV